MMLNLDQFVEQLRMHGQLLSQAADSAGPDAPIPSCPEWNMRDLIHHTGSVHRWAHKHINEASPKILPFNVDQIVGVWPTDEQLVSWFNDGVEQLATVLLAADPDVQLGTFLAAPTPLLFWARRQANETAIHRVDAQLANSGVTQFQPEFACNGVDELLSGFITRTRTPLRSADAVSLSFVATDADRMWTVAISADSVVTVAGSATDSTTNAVAATATVSATSSDLFCLVWNRPTSGVPTVAGDQAVLDLFSSSIRIGQ